MTHLTPTSFEDHPSQKFDQAFIFPSQYEALRRIFSDRQLACVAVIGNKGAGKSTLLNLFARNSTDMFPGGIIWASTASILDFEDSIVSRLPDFHQPRVLVVLDDVDSPEVPRGIVNSLLINTWDRHYNMSLLLSASPGAQKPNQIPEMALELALTGLTDEEMLEVLHRRLAFIPAETGAVWNEDVPENLLRLANGSPRLFLELANAALRDGTWQPIKNGLVSTSRPGLVDLFGRPLAARGGVARQLIGDARAADAELMRRVSFDPDLIYTLSPRRFEELAAALFESLGYSVELTPASKDGGKDLYVARRDDLGSLLFYVECKRYARDRPVGVAVVRQLHGTVEAGRATGGILLTTSHFTSGAREFQSEVRHRLTLNDYADFMAMLRRAGH